MGSGYLCRVLADATRSYGAPADINLGVTVPVPRRLYEPSPGPRSESCRVRESHHACGRRREREYRRGLSLSLSIVVAVSLSVVVAVSLSVAVSVGVDVTVSVGVDVTVSVGVDMSLSLGLRLDIDLE